MRQAGIDERKAEKHLILSPVLLKTCTRGLPGCFPPFSMAHRSHLRSRHLGVSTVISRFCLLWPFLLSLLLCSGVFTAAEKPPKGDGPEDSTEAEDAGSGSAKDDVKPSGGVPVPSIFQVSAEDLPPSFFSPAEPPSRPSSRSGPSPSWIAGGNKGGILVSEIIEADAFSRVGASFGNVLVLTDVDDTLWCSGSMAAFGKHIGGIDSELSRGLPYPAIGTLLFFLALGPHTSTPRGLRIPTEHCPVAMLSPQMHNCPIEVQGPPLLPRSPGVLSARASTSVLAPITRPPSFYSDIEAILTSGARHVYGSFVSRWALGFQNKVRMSHVLSSQHSRGAAKVWGFSEALNSGGPAIVVGDIGEKDPEAAAGMAVKHPEALAAVLLHFVFLDRQKELEMATDPTRNEVPQHAIPLMIT